MPKSIYLVHVANCKNVSIPRDCTKHGQIREILSREKIQNGVIREIKSSEKIYE